MLGTNFALRARHRSETAPIEQPPAGRSVYDACRHIGIGTTTLYSLLKNRELDSYRVGSRRFITTESIERFIARNRAP